MGSSIRDYLDDREEERRKDELVRKISTAEDARIKLIDQLKELNFYNEDDRKTMGEISYLVNNKKKFIASIKLIELIDFKAFQSE